MTVKEEECGKMSLEADGISSTTQDKIQTNNPEMHFQKSNTID